MVVEDETNFHLEFSPLYVVILPHPRFPVILRSWYNFLD